MTEYVLGFRFRRAPGQCLQHVALIRKARPAWQAGKLNGVGGKIDIRDYLAVLDDGISDFNSSNPASYAMAREFEEETGLWVPPQQWRRFGVLSHNDNPIHLYASHGDGEIRSVTDEQVAWYPVDFLHHRTDTMRNLAWIIPMALDPSNVMALITDNSPIPQKENACLTA